MAPCKTSKNCDGNMVCENKLCRDNKKEKTLEYYIEKCKKKNIPIIFEVGPKKGEVKSKDALKRCLSQKSRVKQVMPKAMSAIAKFDLPKVCKVSKDCPTGQVCDKSKKTCRNDKRPKEIEYYIDKCKKKGIPVYYERGPLKGQIKPIATLKRCANQNKRSYVMPSKAKSV